VNIDYHFFPSLPPIFVEFYFFLIGASHG
jgi:hypothetical protein